MEIKVKTGQSLIDIALQTTGTVEAAIDIAAASGLSMTDEPEPGTTLNIPAAGSVAAARQVTERYRTGGIFPATGIAAADLIEDGIEFWSVEYDFTVS
jgi:hypothetical protein